MEIRTSTPAVGYYEQYMRSIHQGPGAVLARAWGAAVGVHVVTVTQSWSPFSVALPWLSESVGDIPVISVSVEFSGGKRLFIIHAQLGKEVGDRM